MSYFLNFIIPTISMLVSVAFYTILERKILGYIQIRKGPNKVGMTGTLQPFSDAIKLFNKTLTSNEMTNYLIYGITPLLSLFLALTILMILPFYFFTLFDNKNNILFFFVISSLSVYTTLLIGWSSNSKFSQLGCIRSIAQMISYEVSFFLIILFISIMSNSYSFFMISLTQENLWFFWGNMILFLMWFVSCTAEVNRSPFDFAEGESELVSGFNVEYMGGWFAMIFLAEYMNMIILMILSVIFFFKMFNNMLMMFMLMIMLILILWIRGSYPRFRYDFLMNLNWKIFLPTILFILNYSLSCSFYSL